MALQETMNFKQSMEDFSREWISSVVNVRILAGLWEKPPSAEQRRDIDSYIQNILYFE